VSSTLSTVFERIYKFAASLKLTVGLLGLSMILILLGTLEQVHWGVWHIQKEYFSSWFCLYPLNNSAPLHLPLPGGFLLGLLLVINLICAHFKKFKDKKGYKHWGIKMIHIGLLLLLVGGFVTAAYQDESAMVIPEKEQRNFTEAFRSFELVVIEHTPNGTDKVVSVPEELLQKKEINLPNTSFCAKVLKYYPNSILRAKSQFPQGEVAQVTQGIGARTPLAYKPIPESFDDNNPNNPLLIIEINSGKVSLGSWILNAQLGESFPAQTFVHEGKNYEINLRKLRQYLPFSITLNQFTHEKYPGTDIPKRFVSDVIVTGEATKFPYTISMNQPMRHGGMTFYQSSFGATAEGKNISVLQVVRNPGWLIPYLSVGLMSLGLLWHFCLSLGQFLSRRTAVTALSVLALGIIPVNAKSAEKNWDTRELGNIPVQSGGRVIPIETLASSSLLQMRARREIALTDVEAIAFGKKPSTWTAEESALIAKELPDLDAAAKTALEVRSVNLNGKSIRALDWFIEVSFRGHVAKFLPTFRVDHPVVLKMMGRDPEKTKFISWNDVIKNSESLTKAAEKSRSLVQSNREAEDRALIQLENAARQYANLAMAFIPGDLPAEISPEQEYQTWLGSLNRAAAQISENKSTNGAAPKFDKELQDSLKFLVERYQNFSREGTIRIVPPLPTNPNQEWDNLGSALLSVITQRDQHRPALATDGTVTRYANFCSAWREGRDDDCALQVRSLYAAHTGTWTVRTDAETIFSRLQAFYWLLIAYFILILFVLWAWVAEKNQSYFNWAFAVLVSIFICHTVALGFRMWLHERPPVTNLYSSGIFIAWGAVLLGIILEKIWRNGIGSIAASISGFMSLIVAHNLGLSGEDNLESVRAVLDSNFWLSTHVTTVTIGYAATFVAGLVASIHLWLRAFKKDYRDGDSVARAAYGILAFATLASFVGTMLGGIWADQSWGRFWGWDPKENGAVLIVLWCAICLHARWGGLVKREGLMQMLVFGNIVTSWSWFGTNLLGVGLHSYGFTESGFFWLCAFAVSQLIIIAIGWLPAREEAQAT
jgi:ABC-type transport system involved in cytochrome c biogenesis permease subunit